MYLSKHGYVIKKDLIKPEDLSKMKIELTAKPLTDVKYFSVGETNYPIYIETKTKMYVPKMYGINKFGFPDNVLKNYEGVSWENEIEFNGELRSNQLDYSKDLLANCYENGGGILNAGTGDGKTVLALHTLSKLKSKTIVIVNKVSLINQWKKEIEKFLPDAKIGIIQGQKNVNVDNCDIVLAMLQSLARIDYPDALFSDFQCSVFDECHNLPSKNFSKIFFKLCCKYSIGLSATPNRSDGCEYIFKWHIGEFINLESKKKTREGKPPIIKVLKINTKEYKEISTTNRFTGQKQIQFTSMLSDLISMPKRNLLIIELIKEFIKEQRTILVLSDRRNHLTLLKELLDKDPTISFTYGLFLGSMKQTDLDKTIRCNLILATFAAFSEGISVKDLDSLILITPKKFIGHLQNSVKKESFKIEQIVGRIFRKTHVERNPVIIDLFDNFSVYKNQFTGRNVFYKDHFKNGIFEELFINLDDNDNVKYNYINKKISKQLKETPIISNICLIED